MADRKDVDRFHEQLVSPRSLTVVVNSYEAYRLSLEDFEHNTKAYKAIQQINQITAAVPDNPASHAHALSLIQQVTQEILKNAGSV